MTGIPAKMDSKKQRYILRNKTGMERRGLQKNCNLRRFLFCKFGGYNEDILQRVRITNPFTRQDMRDESCALDKVGWEATGWKNHLPVSNRHGLLTTKSRAKATNGKRVSKTYSGLLIHII